MSVERDELAEFIKELHSALDDYQYQKRTFLDCILSNEYNTIDVLNVRCIIAKLKIEWDKREKK